MSQKRRLWLYVFLSLFGGSARAFATDTFTIDAFTGLRDAPSSYSGAASKCVTVNGTETGLQFTTCSSGITGITGGSGGTTTGSTVTITGTSPVSTARSSDTITISVSDATSSLKGLATTNQIIGSFGFNLDGGGSTLTTGQKGYVTVPFACTIKAWNITADGSSPTCTIDVWKVATGTSLPTVSNTIMGTKPALSSGNAVHSTTLTNWTTSVSANDIIGFNLDAVTVATKLNFVVQCDKS